MTTHHTIAISGTPLSIEQLEQIAFGTTRPTLTVTQSQQDELHRSCQLISRLLQQGEKIYGINTGFGGMVNVEISPEQMEDSQRNLLSFLAAGSGPAIDPVFTKAAMTLRANVLLQGKSGIRLELIDRLIQFLQVDAIPVVREHGSIGASGDLIPLATIARAITGHPLPTEIHQHGQIRWHHDVLAELNLTPLSLQPKEGLALINGTSFSAAVAALCVAKVKRLFAHSLCVQTMMMTALAVHYSPFEQFVHQQKPHPGQVWVASTFRSLLNRKRLEQFEQQRPLLQDRYSLRCAPQYLGSLVEMLVRITHTIEIEMNSVSDNPLVDSETETLYQSGNFLGQYIAIAMDDLRRVMGLCAKHIDVQIAQLVTPEFSNGLPSSLTGNSNCHINMGLKGLQITGNSLMPLLTYYGSPLTEHFPTHAEQYNQNINGLSWGSSHLACKAVDIFQQYLSVSIIFALQAIDLKASQTEGHYDGRVLLTDEVADYYEQIYRSLDCIPGHQKAFIENDADQSIEHYLEQLNQVFDDVKDWKLIEKVLKTMPDSV